MTDAAVSALKNDSSLKEGTRRPTRMPWVIPVFCDGCASCVNACRAGFLELTESNVPGVFVPWLSEPARCSGCGKCVEACAIGGNFNDCLC